MSTEAQQPQNPESAAAPEPQFEEHVEAPVDPIMANPPPPPSRPTKPDSRRGAQEQQRIQQAIDAALTAEREKLRAEYGTQISQLSGSLQTMQQMIAQREQQAARPQQQAPQEPDSDTLRRQAKKALDDAQYDDYERLMREAAVADARRAAREVYESTGKQQSQQPQGIPPVLMGLLAHHRHVALAGDQGLAWVEHKDRELALAGEPPGPGRVQKAFAAAEEVLKAKASATTAVTQPQFSQASAAVLSGVPTARGPAGGGNTGPRLKGGGLTDMEKDVMRKVKMSEKDYISHLLATHPERFE